METITFRCTTCQSVLKVGADKAGRSAKCTKCGTVLKIPAPKAPPVVAAKAAPKQDEDDDSVAYQLKDLPDPEVEQRQLKALEKTTEITGKGRVEVKRLAKITDPDEWRKTGLGTRIIAGGLCVWMAAFLIYRIPLVIGLLVGPEYAEIADTRLITSQDKLDLCAYGVALIAGNKNVETLIWVMRIALVLSLLKAAPLVAGYFVCMAAPDRFGIRLQLIILLGLSVLNSLFLVVFKLLPLCGAYYYTVLPIVLPEVSMIEMNAERIDTLYTFWLRWPILEATLTLIVTICTYLEPALIATLIRSIALGIKSESLETEALKTMKFAYSQMFIQIVWFMAAMCGTSIVLLWLLRMVYALGATFFVYQLLITVFALFRVSPVVEEQLGDEAATARSRKDDDDEEDEEFEDEDEEDED